MTPMLPVELNDLMQVYGKMESQIAQLRPGDVQGLHRINGSVGYSLTKAIPYLMTHITNLNDYEANLLIQINGLRFGLATANEVAQKLQREVESCEKRIQQLESKPKHMRVKPGSTVEHIEAEAEAEEQEEEEAD